MRESIQGDSLPALPNVGMQFSSFVVIGDPKFLPISSSPTGVPVMPGIAQQPQKTKVNTTATNFFDILVNLKMKQKQKFNKRVNKRTLRKIEKIQAEYRTEMLNREELYVCSQSTALNPVSASPMGSLLSQRTSLLLPKGTFIFPK